MDLPSLRKEIRPTLLRMQLLVLRMHPRAPTLQLPQQNQPPPILPLHRKTRRKRLPQKSRNQPPRQRTQCLCRRLPSHRRSEAPRTRAAGPTVRKSMQTLPETKSNRNTPQRRQRCICLWRVWLPHVLPHAHLRSVLCRSKLPG